VESFQLRALGNLARDPELVTGGAHPFTRFCLVSNDYAGRDDEGTVHEDTTFLWFTAFGRLGEAIAKHARRGDQLFLEARVRNSNYVDKHGNQHFANDFIAYAFRFGRPGRVRREALAAANAQDAQLSKNLNGDVDTELDSPPPAPS